MGLIGLLTVLFMDDTTLDINVHDTYYVIDHMHIAFLLIVLYCIAGTVYWVLRNFRFVKALTVIHTIISVGGVILFWTLLPILRATDDIFVQKAETTEWMIYFAAIFAQLLFIINITIGLTKGRK
ncbi:MAG: hypothetical protein ACO1N9_07065 [Flavobacterium sp.]